MFFDFSNQSVPSYNRVPRDLKKILVFGSPISIFMVKFRMTVASLLLSFWLCKGSTNQRT